MSDSRSEETWLLGLPAKCCGRCKYWRRRENEPPPWVTPYRRECAAPLPTCIEHSRKIPDSIVINRKSMADDDGVRCDMFKRRRSLRGAAPLREKQ